jgi:predicted O-methyltransferase YrrM
MAQIIKNPHEYFDTFVPRRNKFLNQLEKQAALENVHIVGPTLGTLLFLLARSSSAKHILELGTSIGYSAIYLAEALPQNGTVTTVEYGPFIAEQAAANFKRAGVSAKVELIFGEALCVMKELKRHFDMVFMDIDKEFYIKALPDAHRLLRPDGLLIADNTALPEAHPFNLEISKSPDWRFVNLFSHLPGHSPTDDGICIALRI